MAPTFDAVGSRGKNYRETSVIRPPKWEKMWSSGRSCYIYIKRNAENLQKKTKRLKKHCGMLLFTGRFCDFDRFFMDLESTVVTISERLPMTF